MAANGDAGGRRAKRLGCDATDEGNHCDAKRGEPCPRTHLAQTTTHNVEASFARSAPRLEGTRPGGVALSGVRYFLLYSFDHRDDERGARARMKQRDFCPIVVAWTARSPSARSSHLPISSSH
jgi:hypothetical protein